VTNPFFGSTPGRDEIYAYGLRNPWRDSFDRVTGELYIGDVGQSAREEIDIGAPGANYGWRVMEGSICNPGFNGGVCTPPPGSTLPIADYSHTGGRCSITGGYVYRGARGSVPVGTYIYADYCTGEIFQLQGSTQTLLLDSSLLITSFGEDEAGEIYVAHRSGTISRIDSTTPPAACAYSVSPVGTFFTNSGGEGSFNIAAASACNWIAASNVDWIRLTSNSKGNSSDIITFEVRKNFGGAFRTGLIRVGGQTFTVSQGGANCSFRLATKKQTFGAGAGTGGVGVTATGGCEWTASSNASWIVITSGDRYTGNATVTYNVAANTTGAKRVGTMTIAGQTFTVKQKG
jgi:Glucose / Sorbosone dehydrogenase/Putative binding domain, N-terminal